MRKGDGAGKAGGENGPFLLPDSPALSPFLRFFVLRTSESARRLLLYLQSLQCITSMNLSIFQRQMCSSRK